MRVHAHIHGDVNTAFRIRDGEWTQIAKGDPQLPQAFYPMKPVMEIKEGDILLGICTYHNNETRTVYPGSTHTDEMCNIYIMFYTENADQIMDTCSGNSNSELEEKIPADAKIKPGANVDIDSASWSHHPKLDAKNRKYLFVTIFIILVVSAFLVTILVLIKKQKRRRERSSIIRFKQIANDSNLKSRGRFEWVKDWTLNRNRQINFSKLNQNDEDSGSEETVRFNKVSGAPVTENLATDSDSEDVVMSLNR